MEGLFQHRYYSISSGKKIQKLFEKNEKTHEKTLDKQRMVSYNNKA
jgi:hypothetical protein